MNFYSLPIIVNDRRSLLLELTEAASSRRLNSFIVEVPDITGFNLCSILSKGVIKTFVEGRKDIALQHLASVCTFNGDTVSWRLFQPESPKPAENEEPATKERLSYEDLENYSAGVRKAPEQIVIPPQFLQLGNANSHVALQYESGQGGMFLKGRQSQEIDQTLFDRNKITVRIELETDGVVYANQFDLYLAHPAQFLGIALDFGSESSQMAVKRYTNDFSLQERKPEIENLFRNIVSFHKSNGWVSQHETVDFYQEEKNTSFYKSLFFLKEQLTGEYQDIDQEVFIRNIADNLKMLVNTKDGYQTLSEQKFHQLPNLKIIHKHEDLLSGLSFEIEKQGYGIPIKLSEIKQKVYNTILKVMITSFLKKEFIRYEKATRFIRLMLLVPNIYDTNDIHYIQRQLHQIFADLAEHEYRDRILAWEVLTISESDASFIGYINKHNTSIRKDSDYIIIDSGKGTTDFSIIRTGTDNIYDLKPVYRNGFTGAGNMITYAIFETILHYIRETNQSAASDIKFIKDRIVKVLTGNDLERKNNFYNELERLKFNYREHADLSLIRNAWQHARSGDIGFRDLIDYGDGINTLIGLLGNLESVGDFYGYINEACNFIADNTVHYLKLIKEHKKDFNCAGIILTGRSFMFRPLAERMRSKLAAALQVDDASITLLHSSELKDICIKGVFNNSIRLNTEITGYPIQLIFDEPQPESKPLFKKPAFNGRSLFARLFNDLNNFDHVEKVLAFDGQLNVAKLQHSQFLIGARTYRIQNGELFRILPGEHYEASVDFTHKGYYLRRMKNGVVDGIAPMKVVDDSDNSDMSLIIPSLFPNYIDVRYLLSLERDDVKPPRTSSDDISPADNNSNPLYF
jgi:hypothetical protein